MKSLISKDTEMIIVGITGKQGQIHAKRMLESGAKLVAGVTPGKGGENVHGVPVYNSVAEARIDFPEAKSAMILVPAKFVLESAMAALSSGIELLVLITEFVPVLDSLKIVSEAKKRGARVIGPNTIGVIAPGKSKLGIMPSYIYSEGHVAVVSRSGTLTHETASNLTFKGFGQSVCIGIGGDPIIGTNHAEAIELLADDENTDAIVLIGEIGGVSEELAAQKIIELGLKKPVCAYIAGANAPEGKKMGHAGAIVSGGMGTAKSKISALQSAGVTICPTLGSIVEFVQKVNDETNGRLKTTEAKIG